MNERASLMKRLKKAVLNHFCFHKLALILSLLWILLLLSGFIMSCTYAKLLSPFYSTVPERFLIDLLFGLCLGTFISFTNMDWLTKHAFPYLLPIVSLNIIWKIIFSKLWNGSVGLQLFPYLGIMKVDMSILFAALYLSAFCGVIISDKNRFGKFDFHSLLTAVLIVLASALCTENAYRIVLYLTLAGIFVIAGFIEPGNRSLSTPNRQKTKKWELTAMRVLCFLTGLGILLALKGKNYLSAKWSAFINPTNSALTNGYAHERAAQIKLHTGLWGFGAQALYGNAGLNLPDFNHASVLTYLLARWGWAAIILLLLLTVTLGWQLVQACRSLQGGSLRIPEYCVVFYILIQFLWNWAMFAGLCPIVNIAFPFLSYNPAMTVMNMVLFIWLLVQIWKTESKAAGAI